MIDVHKMKHIFELNHFEEQSAYFAIVNNGQRILFRGSMRYIHIFL